MSNQTAVFKQIPHSIHFLFELPPILQSESADHYFRLMAECIYFYQPHEIVDWIYLKDFVDYAWEVVRMRKIGRCCLRPSANVPSASWLARF